MQRNLALPFLLKASLDYVFLVFKRITCSLIEYPHKSLQIRLTDSKALASEIMETDHR